MPNFGSKEPSKLRIIRMGSDATTIKPGERDCAHVDRPEQTINYMGSLALICNNVIGPGIMSLPGLFRAAGILPTSLALCFVCFCASLCGTFLSQTIAAIPGNKNYGLGVDFSQAFKLLLGDAWYAVAETLFVSSCMVQATSAIVQTSQCLDSLLATFLLPKVYALQLAPTVEIVSWSASSCGDQSNLADCTPFNDNGTLVFTMGYFLMMLFYWPIGRGHLKETMSLQLIAFFAMFSTTFVFDWEFMNPHGQGAEPLPWVGTDFSRLGGIVLFNYAFSVTVPAWLQEKKTDVSPNKIIWTSSILSTFIYISFGWLAAASFPDPGENVLTLLSSPQVHGTTRVAAAIFGVLIIGSGVPVFCVMMKDVLYSGNILSPGNALFVGSSLPYVFSWTLYKGTLLLSVLNWAGLIINGTVAFLLPVTLVVLSHHYYRKYSSTGDFNMTLSASSLSVVNKAGRNSGYGSLDTGDIERNKEFDSRSMYVAGDDEDKEEVPIENEVMPLVPEDSTASKPVKGRPKALPVPLRPYIEHIAVFIMFSFLAIIIFTLWVDIKQGMQ